MSHHCHAAGCTVKTPPKLLMCRRHWYMVPAPLRALVWKHYRAGQERDKRPSKEYLAVAFQAIKAVAVAEGRVPADA